MNVLKDDKKKKYVIGGILVILLVLIGVWLLQGVDKKDNKKRGNPVNNILKDIKEGNSWSDRGDYAYSNDNIDKKEDSKNNIPLVYYGGQLQTYKDFSTYAELAIKIKDNLMSFRMNPSSIVFDTKSKEIVIPSSLKEFKGKVRVLAYSEKEGILPKAEVVIMNDDPNLLYANVTSVIETDSGLMLLDDDNKKGYIVNKNIKVVNAVSKGVLEKERLKEGSKLFVYPKSSFKQEKLDIRDGEMYGVLEVKDVYVYPTKK